MNIPNLPTAEWDLISFFENANEYVGVAGGGLLTLMGTFGVIWGGVRLINKLISPHRDQTSWVTIIALILIGGAFMVSGFSIISNIAAGGRTTIEDLGGGMILFHGILSFIS